MKKLLLIMAIILMAAPSFAVPTANTTTVTPRQMIPLDQMIDRAKLQEDAKRNAIQLKQQEQKANIEAKKSEIQSKQQENKEAIEAKKNEIQNKIQQKQDEYALQEQQRAQKRVEMQEANEARKEQLKKDMEANKNTIHGIRRETINNIETVKSDVAREVTEMRKAQQTAAEAEDAE